MWVGPPAPPLTAEETRRVISISDPSKSSRGSQLFHATQEQESELLGNLFCQSTLKLLFLDPPLDWATGRVDAIPVLRWRHRCPPSSHFHFQFHCFFLIIIFTPFLICSALAVEVKLGPERIGARTDGGLQIFLPQNGSLVAWDRSYYEVALEVPLYHHYNN